MTSNRWPLALWNRYDVPITSCEDGSVVVLNGKIYLVGGKKHGSPAKTYRSLVIDPSNGSVRYLPPMKTPRHGAMGGGVGELIVVAGGCWDGGQKSFKRFNTVEIYNPNSDSWSKGPPLPYPLSWAAHGVIDDKLIVAGGFSSRRSRRTLILDLNRGYWYNAAPMPRAISHAAGVVFNGNLFVFGGIGGKLWLHQRSCYIYNLVSNRWKTGPQMPVARACFSAAVLSKEIIITGGTAGYVGVSHKEVFVYNPKSKDYGTSLPMCYSRSRHDVCVVNHKIYAFGGNKRFPAEVATRNFMKIGIIPSSRKVGLHCELWLVNGLLREKRIDSSIEEVLFPSFRSLTVHPVYIPSGAKISIRNYGKIPLLIKDASHSETLSQGRSINWPLRNKDKITLIPVKE